MNPTWAQFLSVAMPHPMISEIEPSLGLDAITDETRGGGRTRSAPRGSSQRFSHAFPTIALSERRAITRSTTTADVRRAITQFE